MSNNLTFAGKNQRCLLPESVETAHWYETAHLIISVVFLPKAPVQDTFEDYFRQNARVGKRFHLIILLIPAQLKK